jgi:hypothetical protein
MVEMRVPFCKTVWGFMVIEVPEGRDLQDYMETDWNGVPTDEFDNKSEYEYVYAEAEIETDVEQTRKEMRDERGD